jgi:NADPH-dependent 2,4-dienoyl-CoA reductase/sulfur reductase-like enzyme
LLESVSTAAETSACVAADERSVMVPAQQAALRDGIVVLGAGQAGGRAVEALRAHGFSGSITLVGDEADPPYERPSLSKEMLLNPDAETVAWVHADDYLARQGVAFHSGIAAKRIDRAARRVVLTDGRSITYGALILATGRRARRLGIAGGELPSCLYLRNLNDSRALRGRLRPGLRILIVGAGFIGLEVAAAAVQRGGDVTVLEAGEAPLGRAVPPALGRTLLDLHEGHGVRFAFGTQLTRFLPKGDGLVAVTKEEARFEADLAVIGIGAEPNCEVAAEAGLAVDGGIVTDAFGATSDPLIFAVGDVAAHFNPMVGRHLVLESWQNAQNAAIAVARNLARPDAVAPYAEVPWFWSDQYASNLQIYGLMQAGARNVVRRRPDGRCLHFQVLDGRLIFAAGIGAARELRVAQDLIRTGVQVADSELADPTISLSTLLKRA